MWAWHWPVLGVGIVVFYPFIGFLRGSSIETYMEKCGPRPDWQEAFRNEPFAIISGALVAATIYSAIGTAVAGFLF
jgi:hypothetical protein